MRNSVRTILSGLCAAICLTTSSTGLAQEKKITKKDVPAAVLSAFEKSYPHAMVKSFSKESENGKTYYEVESIEGKTPRDILYLSDGTATEVEEGVSTADLPASVKASVMKKHPEGKIIRAERTTRDSVVTYEMRVKSGKTTFEVVVDPSGKIVKEKNSAGRKKEPENED
jgi:uncharacterized membrane protein YkoI